MWKNRITRKEVIDFNKSLSLMLISRLQLVQALELLSLQFKNDSFRSVIKKILQSVKSGASLSQSFSKFPRLFPEVYIANLKVAEETGHVAEVLSEYTSYMEKIEELKRKILQAARYPALVLIIAFAVVIFMVFFLIPTFQGLFSSARLSLPPVTEAIMLISSLVKDNIYPVIFFIIAAILLILKLKDSEAVKAFIDKKLSSLPVVQKLYTKNLVARFSLSMAFLLKHKVTLLEALKISRNISTSRLFKSEIDAIIKRLIKGEAFSSRLSKSRFFDPTFTGLLNVGEESAELEKVFYLIAEYYEKEFNYYLDNITSMIEPFLILIVGLIVALILIAMYLPMFELINNFGI